MRRKYRRFLKYLVRNGGDGVFIDVENYSGFSRSHQQSLEFQKCVHQLKEDGLIVTDRGHFMYPVINGEAVNDPLYDGPLYAKITLKGEEKLQQSNWMTVPVVIAILILLFGILNWLK